MKYIKLFESFINESENKTNILAELNKFKKFTKEEAKALFDLGLEKLKAATKDNSGDGQEYTDNHYNEFIQDVNSAISDIDEFMELLNTTDKDFTDHYNLACAVTAFANGNPIEDYIIESKVNESLVLNKDNKGPVDSWSYLGDLSKEDAEALAKELGMVKDPSESIPADMPAFTLPGGDEEIFIETGYGVSFDPENFEKVEAAIKKL